jgi:hypothetical protein
MNDRAVVFVGPCLNEPDFIAIDNDRIELLPPIRRGDLPKTVDAGYQTIGIIDGEFLHSLAVSPKEVLAALESGCRIIGGSSMGALRAAELDVYGMEGIGTIYDWYRTGVVTRDDDVGLIFSRLDTRDYRTTTVPMVNVRWAMLEFKRLGLLPADRRRRISGAARRMHWTERTWPRVCEVAGLDAETCQSVLSWTANPDNDLKRLDALLVLERVAAAVASDSQTGNAESSIADTEVAR